MAARLAELQRTIGNVAVVRYVQRLSEPEEGRPAAIHQALSTRGDPIDPPTREQMEEHLGADLSDVRLHVSRRATESVAASAFTVGSDVVVHPDRYSPGTTSTQRLLAHELTHVVQQRSGPVDGTPVGGGISVSDPGDRFEREAEASATAMLSGARAPGASGARAPRAGSAPGAPGDRSEGAQLQRFPATTLSMPVFNWKDLAADDVRRSSGGMSGGVYFLKAKENVGPDEISKVVVKPHFGQTGMGNKEKAEQLAFADRALGSLFGINTPNSRVTRDPNELASLKSLLKPAQGERGPEPARDDFERHSLWEWWQDINEAEAFIIMGEIPRAKGVDELAKGATRRGEEGTRARQDLENLLFADPEFLGQLARLSVADVLLGNVDRLVLGGMNIGNVMVSIAGGKATIHAIDQSADLDRDETPESIISDGGSPGRDMTRTKDTVKDPGKIVDGFYNAVIGAVAGQEERPVEEGGVAPKPLSEILRDKYEANKDRIATIFHFAWQITLLEIVDLLDKKGGVDKLKQLTDEFSGGKGSQSLSYHTLRARAIYLAGLSEKASETAYKGHEDVARKAAAYQAYAQLRELDTTRLGPPDDEFGPLSAGRLPSGAKTADLADFEISPPKDTYVKGVVGRSSRDKYNPVGLEKSRELAEFIEASLARLGTKKRVLKGEVSRNRVVAGNYVARSHLVAAGALRLSSLLFDVRKALKNLEPAMAGTGRHELAELLPIAEALPRAIEALVAQAAAYEQSLNELTTNIKSLRKFRARMTLADSLTGVAGMLRANFDYHLEQIRQLDPEAKIQLLRQRAQA